MQTLERYWRDVQKHGHHASLLGLSASNPDGLDDQSAAALVDVIQLKVWSHGSLSACARALWASAHWHLPRFDAVTKAVLEPLPSPHRVGRLVEIAVLGLAHAPLFEKARRFLSGNAEVFEALSQAGSPRLQALFAEVFAHPLASIRRVEAEGLAAMARARIHGGSRFEALQFALLQPVNVFARGQRSLETLIRALPFIAHCKAEELYLPEVVLNASGLRQVDRQTIEANVEAARLTSAHTPALREDRRGRNELCGCGSGKKHKRCCLVTV